MGAQIASSDRPKSSTTNSTRRPRVVYASTREATYARNQTLIRALRHYADVEVFAAAGDGQGFERRVTYAWGVLRVATRLLCRAFHPVRGRDTLVLGFLAQPLALLLRPFWRGRLVADAMVSVYDTVCFDKQLVVADSIPGRVARWTDRFLVHRADALVFDTQQHREYFRTFTADDLPPSCVVPVGARCLRSAPPVERRSQRLQVVFAGSYVPLQGAPVIVEAAAILKNEPIDFTMIGSGQQFHAVGSAVRSQALTNVRLLGWLDLDRLDEWYHRADVILGIFGLTDKTRRVVPNKVYEALSIGQPVITSDTPAIRELFVPDQDLICSTAGDSASLARAILWVSSHREQAREIGRAGRVAFEQHASDGALAAALAPVFGRTG